MALPAGWQVSPPPANAPSLQIYALNRQIDAGLGVTTLEREDVPDFERWANNVIQQDASRAMEDVEKSQPEWTTLDGRRAVRMVMTGTIKSNGVRMRFLLTAIQGERRVLRVTLWSRASAFEENRAGFLRMTESVAEAGG